MIVRYSLTYFSHCTFAAKLLHAFHSKKTKLSAQDYVGNISGHSQGKAKK